MPVIVNEDFENWNVNSWLIYSNGTQIVYDGIGRSGSKGLYLETSKGLNNKEMIYRYPTAMDELTLTAYINIHLLDLSLASCDAFIYVEDGDASLAQYMVGFKKIGGVPWFRAYSGAVDTYYDLQPITYGQWYKIKLVIKRDATNGYDKLYIDDVLVVDNTGINTELAGGGGMDGFYFGMVGGQAVDWWFDMDDILIENEVPLESTIPTVETYVATGILTTSVTLNGEITNIGGANCDERGFEWGTEHEVYTDDWTEIGTFGVGTFNYNLTELISGKTYYYRAKAHNSAGWGYGQEIIFVLQFMNLLNASRNHCFERVLNLKISQTVDVATRPVPTREDGEVIDTGTYLIHPIQVTFDSRLTDAEKTVIQAMLDDHLTITLYLGNWTFSDGWFVSKGVVWEYVSDDELNIRPWKCSFELIFESVTYTPP